MFYEIYNCMWMEVPELQSNAIGEMCKICLMLEDCQVFVMMKNMDYRFFSVRNLAQSPVVKVS